MKITKLGHSCLFIEEGSIKILTDPGDFSDTQDQVRGITHVFITHEHSDHCHLSSLQKILLNNPSAKIYTNSSVGSMLSDININYELMKSGSKLDFDGFAVEAIGQEHHMIHPTMPAISNTGYIFNNKFFYPGDALTNPKRTIDILALPITAPWLTITAAIDYARLIKPKRCFPVHDGNIKIPGALYRLPAKILQPEGINFEVFELGKTYEI